MRVRMALCGGLLAFLGVACLGPSQPADNTCESFGGVCVSGSQACNGSLPYACDQGVCCSPGPDSGSTSPAPTDGGSHS